MDAADISLDTEFYHFVDIISDQPDSEVLMAVGVGERGELYGIFSPFYNTIPKGRSRVCFCEIHRFNQQSDLKIMKLILKYRSNTGAKLIKTTHLRSEFEGQEVHGRLLAVNSPKTVSRLTYLCVRTLDQSQYEELPQTEVFQERAYQKTKKIKWTIEQDIVMEDMDTCSCNE